MTKIDLTVKFFDLLISVKIIHELFQSFFSIFWHEKSENRKEQEIILKN